MTGKGVTAGLWAFLGAALAAGPAFAAGVSGDESGWLSGLLHPVLGFDHFLAMIAVGLVSVQLGGRAIWMAPAAFVAFLGIGGALGMAGIALPQVEGVIALSVLALGLAIAMRAAAPTPLAMLVVGAFAVFHGHAHGAEIPSLAQPWAYAIGFMSASAILHLTGVALGLIAGRPDLRAMFGAGVAGIGLHMVLLTYALV